MREILFRGKTSTEWVYGDLRHLNDGRVAIRKDGEIYPYEVIPETVGQYTGLTDKNGKRIFEGDIIEFTDDIGEKSLHIVQWSDDYSGWATQDADMKYTAETMDHWDDCREWYEVIGNIHDNPELLTEESNG